MITNVFLEKWELLADGRMRAICSLEVDGKPTDRDFVVSADDPIAGIAALVKADNAREQKLIELEKTLTPHTAIDITPDPVA